MQDRLLQEIEALKAENAQIKALLEMLCSHFNVGVNPRQNILLLKERARAKANTIINKYEHKTSGR